MATIPNIYAELDDVKAGLPDTDWGGSYDIFIEDGLAAASRLIDKLTGQAPGAFLVDSDETRYFTGGGSQLWIDPLAGAPTTVSMDLIGDQVTYTLIPSSDYQMWPRDAAQKGVPFYRIDIPQLINPTYYTWYGTPDAIEIVGPWGYSIVVPDLIKRATLIQVTRWLKRAQQSYQDTGAIVQLSQLTYTKKLDPDVENIINLDFNRIAI